MTVPAFLALVVVALASYRAQRIVTSDSLTDDARSWVWRRAYEPVDVYDSLADTDQRTDVRSNVWAWTYRGLSCPWCVGWWTSLAMFGAWHYWHAGFVRPLIAAVAVAGMQGFVSSRSDA